MNARTLLRRGSRIACLLLLPLALWGCLDHVASGVTPGQPAVATVPDAFFQATPVACCQTPEANGPVSQPGRYTLRGVTAVAQSDPAAGYALALAGPETRVVRIALSIDDLRDPRTPDTYYELVTSAGVFPALASGEWDPVTPVTVTSTTTYHQQGALLFVVPRAVVGGRLDIVAYYYPQPAPITNTAPAPTPAPLVRQVVASFAIPSLP
ncbi:MAG: hypothetical protein ACTHMJ_22690 [Thermomicrobiales bacterium]